MNEQVLLNTVEQLLAGDNGLLAMDESIDTCNKRFCSIGNASDSRSQAQFPLMDCHYAGSQ